MEFTAFRHLAGNGYMVFLGSIERPEGEPYETRMSKSNLKFLEKRGATIHWKEEWSL